MFRGLIETRTVSHDTHTRRQDIHVVQSYLAMSFRERGREKNEMF